MNEANFQFSIWAIIVNVILIVLILPGGFFMMRAFLRRMKREEGLDQMDQNKNRE